MSTLTYAEAEAVHETLAADSVIYPFVRSWAANRMLDRTPHAECGSSDISIEVTESLQYFDVPLVGPVVAAYAAHGITVDDARTTNFL